MAIRIYLKSLITNRAVFFVLVALLPSKMTVKTAKTVILKLYYNPNNLGNLIQAQQKIPSEIISNVSYSENFEKFVMWRHNGFFDVFLCGTLTSLILVQFFSHWYILLISVWHCTGLQTSVFRWYLQFNMADQNGKNDR